MAHIFQLTPELERRLAAQARLAGVSLEAYVQSILERQLAMASHTGLMSDEEFNSLLDGVAAYSEKVPLLPLDALSRDEIYRDHD